MQVLSVKSYQVEKIHFSFDHFGWMSVFLDDMGKNTSNYNSGEVAIHSDWGVWAYTWTGICETESLHEFICSADNDYLARKLLAGAIEDKPWEYVENKPTAEYSILTEILLPALKAYLKDYLNANHS